MSFRALLTVAGTIGVGGVATVVLWQTGNLDSSTSASLSSSENSSVGREATTEQGASLSLPTQEVKSVNLGNCVVVGTVDEEIFSELRIDKEEYTAIECKNTNLESSERNIENNWTGLFPNELLIEGDGLELGTRFNMTTDTKEDDDRDYKTTFSGSKFYYRTLSGEWERETKKISGKLITEVKVEEGVSENRQPIYLLFPEQKD